MPCADREGCGNFSAAGSRCPGQTNAEYRTEWGLNAIASGQLLFASDPRNMTALQRELWLNEEVLEVFRDVSGLTKVAMVSNNTVAPPEPDRCGVELTKQLSHGSGCVQGQQFGCLSGAAGPAIWVAGGCRAIFTCFGTTNVLCESAGSGYPARNNVTCSCNPPAPQVWVRPLAVAPPPSRQATVAALLVNAGDDVADVTLRFEDVPGWAASTAAAVRNLWTHADAGLATGEYTAAAVPPHDSVFIRLAQR